MGFDAPGKQHICSAASNFPGKPCSDVTQDFYYTGVDSAYCLAHPGICVTPSTAARNPYYSKFGGRTLSRK